MENKIRKVIAAAMIMILIIPSAWTGMVYAEEGNINEAAGYETDAPETQEEQIQPDVEKTETGSETKTETETETETEESSSSDDRTEENRDAGIVENEQLQSEETGENDGVRDPSCDEEQETEEAVEEEEPKKSDDTEENVIDDEPFDAARADYLSYDPLYIAKYGSSKYIDTSEIDMTCFYNIKAAAKGIATYNIKTQGDFKVTEQNFIAGLVYEMPLYDVDPSSKYYLAIPNVNLFNDNFKAFDLQVGYNNDYAEMINGWKYVRGILYIPKKAVDSPDNDHSIPDGEPVAIQLNYAIGGDMDFSKQIPVQILDGEEPVEKTLNVANFFAAEGIEISTGIKNRKSSDVFVYLNGSLIPANEGSYNYDASSGKVQINVSAGVTSNVNIVFNPRTRAQKAKDIVTSFVDAVTPAAFAGSLVNMDQMQFIKDSHGKEIVLEVTPDTLFVGWRGHFNGKRIHGNTAKNKEKYQTMLDSPGWKNSIKYMYSGYDENDYAGGEYSESYRAKHMSATWAYSSYAVASDIDPRKSGEPTIDSASEKVTFWNAIEEKEQTKTIYEWLLLYQNYLELSKDNTGVEGSSQRNNGLGGVNNFAFTFPKKIEGASTRLVSSGANAGRNNGDVAIKSDQIASAQGSGATAAYYDYWLCASCNHLDEAEGDEGEGNSSFYVTCLGLGSDYVVLAFVQTGGKGKQNACGVYKFKVESSGFAKVRKVSSRKDVLSLPEYSLAGAVYYLYTDKGFTKRARNVNGENIVLTTKANGETNAAEVEPGITYYAKEITPSPGFELDNNVNGGKGITVTTANDEKNPVVFNSTEVPKKAYVTLTKSAAVTDTSFLTEAPNNYTLKGAVYNLYTDEACKTPAKDFGGDDAVLTTNASGKTAVLDMKPGTYYAKEVTASKGFKLDKAVKKVILKLTHTKSEPFEIKSTEEPVYGPLFQLRKTDKTGNNGWKNMIGAKYRISYYDVDPSTANVSGQPKRSWTFKTVKKINKTTNDPYAGIDFTSDAPVSGDDFYLGVIDGKETRILPAGVFTLEEVEAPKGLARDETVYYGKVYQTSNGSDAKRDINSKSDTDLTFEVGSENDVINHEKPQSVTIAIDKKDAETGEAKAQGIDRDHAAGSLAGAEYDVLFDDPRLSQPAKVGTIITDESGHGKLSADLNGEDLALGRYYVKEVKASPGYTIDAMYLNDTPGKYEDGRHIIVARASEINTGKFTYTVTSPEKPHHTYVSKTDITTGDELPGALLQVIDSAGNIVEQWTSTDKPHDIVALHDETQGLKDGKYILREITAPYGYDVAEDVEFKVSSNAVENTVEMKNKPITIGTTANDDESQSHIGRFDTDEKVMDEVRVTGLYAGREYRISGTMMDKDTGKPMKDTSGNDITAEKTFTADSEEMTVTLEFGIDSSQFTRETTTVAFEKLYRTRKVHEIETDVVPVELQKHEDINDEAQTIHYGGIASTTAVDKTSKSHNVLASENVVVEDTVEYTNLSTENEYTIEGELYDKTTGKLTGIRGFAKFKPESTNGKVAVDFEFDSSALENHTLVAYEVLSVISKIGGKETPVVIDRHEEPDDEDQTVHIPKIRTTASDTETGDHIAMAATDTVLRDVVRYENLIPGKTYTLKGKMVYKDNGNDVIIDGETVTAETKFTPDSYDGEVTLEFVFDTSAIAGKKIVAFEEVYEEYLVAVHADIQDEEQTVNIPEIRTTAVDTATDDHVAASEDYITITDTVRYKNLLPGYEYVMRGTLISREKCEPVMMSGTDVTAETTFTPQEENGEVQLEFTLPRKDYEGDASVAFEECYIILRDEETGHTREVLIAEHKDINDEGQTVHIPALRTTMADTETEGHVSHGDEEVIVVDTVKYKHLSPGKEYFVTGVLIDKGTGEILKENGESVSGSASFTPESSNGSVDVKFSFDGRKVCGRKFVAYEYLYYKDIPIAVHANINDEDQSVQISSPGPSSPKTGDDNILKVYIVVITASLAALLIAILRKRKA